MTLKPLRAALLTRLAELLMPQGYRKREQSFHKESGPVRLSFHVAFINHAQDFDVTADVAVRHHAIEERLGSGKDLTTIGAELGNIAGVGQHRWRVAAEEDLEPVTHSILEYFHQHGEPFLARFSDPTELLRVLDQESHEARLICPIPDRRKRVVESLRKLDSGRPDGGHLR